MGLLLFALDTPPVKHLDKPVALLSFLPRSLQILTVHTLSDQPNVAKKNVLNMFYLHVDSFRLVSVFCFCFVFTHFCHTTA